MFFIEQNSLENMIIIFTESNTRNNYRTLGCRDELRSCIGSFSICLHLLHQQTYNQGKMPCTTATKSAWRAAWVPAYWHIPVLRHMIVTQALQYICCRSEDAFRTGHPAAGAKQWQSLIRCLSLLVWPQKHSPERQGLASLTMLILLSSI